MDWGIFLTGLASAGRSWRPGPMWPWPTAMAWRPWISRAGGRWTHPKAPELTRNFCVFFLETLRIDKSHHFWRKDHGYLQIFHDFPVNIINQCIEADRRLDLTGWRDGMMAAVVHLRSFLPSFLPSLLPSFLPSLLPSFFPLVWTAWTYSYALAKQHAGDWRQREDQFLILLQEAMERRTWLVRLVARTDGLTQSVMYKSPRRMRELPRWRPWMVGVRGWSDSIGGKVSVQLASCVDQVCRICVQYRHIMTFARTHIYTHTHMCICILYEICMMYIYIYIHVYITYTNRLYIVCMHIQTSDVLTWIPWAFRTFPTVNRFQRDQSDLLSRCNGITAGPLSSFPVDIADTSCSPTCAKTLKTESGSLCKN